MVVKEINWNRVIANGGITFCTTMLGYGAIAGMSPQTLFGALATSVITGGLALFTELKNEGEEDGKIASVINAGLIL